MAASSGACTRSSTSPGPHGTATPPFTAGARPSASKREREIVKTGERSLEVTRCLTSLAPERAGPRELGALIRNHGVIDNRVHDVRDLTYDEDRCRAHVGHLPRNLACLTNAAIAIVRCGGRFTCMPEANRHDAARSQEALDLILNPPGA